MSGVAVFRKRYFYSVIIVHTPPPPPSAPIQRAPPSVPSQRYLGTFYKHARKRERKGSEKRREKGEVRDGTFFFASACFSYLSI